MGPIIGTSYDHGSPMEWAGTDLSGLDKTLVTVSE